MKFLFFELSILLFEAWWAEFCKAREWTDRKKVDNGVFSVGCFDDEICS